MKQETLKGLLVAAALLLIGLAWWGWQQGGLALLQMGLSVC
ncbi:hypothetical protein [Pseudomonas sp. TTU2014-080ASC]|nr:hypothetical protein [Pseudomonas sp. TTU2014-080ASC]